MMNSDRLSIILLRKSFLASFSSISVLAVKVQAKEKMKATTLLLKSFHVACPDL